MENFLSLAFDPSNQLYQLLIALFLGIFVGLRREMIFQKEGFEGIMGVRTISIFVILGTLTTFFPSFSYLPVLVFGGVFIFMIIAYYNGVFNLKRIGLTSELSALIMYWVGVLVGQEKILLAIFLTAIMGIFTAYKKSFHSFAKNFSLKEWSGTLQLLIVTAIILPLLPRESIDPFNIFVPFDIWLLVIFISSIGFFGYFFDKYFSKKKSVLLTSILGSLVSSTAVSTSLALKSKKKRKINSDLLSSGLMASIAVMQTRVLITLLILSGGFYLNFIIAPIFMIIVSIIFFSYFWYKYKKSPSFHNKKEESNFKEMEIKSPFSIWPAMQFSILFIVILFAIYFAKKYFNNSGAYIVSFLASFADADAVILSTLESFKKLGEDPNFVSIIILIPVIVNTLVKILYIFIFGRKSFFKKIFFPISFVSLLGLLSYLII